MEFFIYFFCCFPFVSPINFGTDMQPYALVLSVVYLIINRRNIKPIFFHNFWLIYISIILIFIALAFGNNTMSALRTFLNIISVPIISFAVYNILEKAGKLNERYIKIFIIIWLTIGVIQLLFATKFGDFIVPSMRTTKERGVCSLATEPSYYGYICFFFVIIAQKFQTYKTLFSIILVFQILFTAQSSVSLVYLTIYLSFSLIQRQIISHNIKSLAIIVIGLALFPIIIYTIGKFMPNSRINELITRLLNGGELLSDGSIKIRFESIALSIGGFIDYFGLPHGFSSFDEEAFSRISSGYGGLLYQLGVIGLVYIVLYSYYIYKSFDLATSLTILLTMFSAVQFGNPLFAFLIGYCMHLNIGKDKFIPYENSR